MLRNAALFALALVVLLALFTGLPAHPVGALALILIAAAAGVAWNAAPANSPRTSTSPTPPAPPLAVSTMQADPAGDRAALDEALQLVCDVTAARAAILWRTDPVAGLLRPTAAHGRALPAPRTLHGDPLAWVAREGTPLRIDPAPPWAETGTVVHAVRLWSGEDRGWLVTVEVDAAAVPSPASLAAGVAPLRLLVRLQDEQVETENVRRRMQQLLDLLHRIPVVTELEAAAGELIAACSAITGGTGGTVALWHEDVGRIVAVSGDDGGPPVGGTFESPTSELALSVRAGGLLVRPPGAWKPGPTHIATPADRWNSRVRSLAAIPLATPEGVTSILGIWTTEDRALDPAGLEMVLAIAPYAALHLQHAHNFGKLRQTADTDALTGLRNRRAFDVALKLEVGRFERYGRPIALLMVDADHFKAVNDQHGHEAGDHVLQHIARTVRSCIRDIDTAARFGGEEFAVLLPETPIAQARQVAERIRAAIAASDVAYNGRSIPLTASIGVAGAPESVPSADLLLTAADENLYEAKRGGRDRVV
jgi:diguanylate cyclase (GGDEF)-like protein